MYFGLPKMYTDVLYNYTKYGLNILIQNYIYSLFAQESFKKFVNLSKILRIAFLLFIVHVKSSYKYMHMQC